MKIINDKISLDPEDIALFSPAAQKALAFPESGNVGGLNPRTYKEVSETAFNQALANALEIWRKTLVIEVAPLIEALEVEADSGKRAQVALLIDQAKEVLNVKEDKDTAVGLNPTAEPQVPK